MKRYVFLAVLLSLSLGFSRPAEAQTNDFQEGVRIVSVVSAQLVVFFYAKANGEVYVRPTVTLPWAGPPIYLGNFFGDQLAPGDFLAGLRAVLVDGGNVFLYFASSTGDVFHQVGYPSPGVWSTPAHNDGNFFLGQSAPPDFQQGYHIIRVGAVVTHNYVTPSGDLYRQDPTDPWIFPPYYSGNFFGQEPVPTSPTTFGKIKALYQPKSGKP